MQNEIFQKKDVIYSETLGVCVVQELTKLSQDRGESYQYYGLRSYYHKTKVAYIPVEDHQVKLRRLMDADTASAKLKDLQENAVDGVLQADSKEIEEIAYVLQIKITDLLPEEEE